MDFESNNKTESTKSETISVPIEAAGSRLDIWLAQQLPDLSRARLQAMIAAGDITVDSQNVKSSQKIRVGNLITINYQPPIPAEPLPENIPLDILFEDQDLLAINKPAGLVVHPAPGHSNGTLVNALLHHCRNSLGGIGGIARPGIVHRLDKDTSGIMVVAKNDQSMAALVRLFQSCKIHKEYIAIAHGIFNHKSGTVESHIGRHPVDRKRMAVTTTHGKNAITHYKIKTQFAAAALLQVKIETGRTHQIRVHLSNLDHPIAGDQVYGSRTKDNLLPDCPQRQMLHAARLTFVHPATSQLLDLKSHIPSDMKSFLQRLRLTTCT